MGIGPDASIDILVLERELKLDVNTDLVTAARRGVVSRTAFDWGFWSIVEMISLAVNETRLKYPRAAHTHRRYAEADTHNRGDRVHDQ